MDIKNNILETIGNTPMVRLNRIAEDIPGTILAKVEYFNPGHSVKDRMALKMVEDAEARGDIKPGGTLIECTSGNTGMGLALACIVKGYKLICTMSDKQSKEKVDILRAVGAEVYVCPTNVSPEHPESYYSVAKRKSEEIENSFWVNQYDNPSNSLAHYESTGPEIWDQTDGKITHFVVGVGTGGTISGVGKYLKEKNPAIKIWGVDSYGSVFKKYLETGEFDEKEVYSYITEGIGEDILPKNVDFDLIDHFEKVTDRDGALAARDLAKMEGLFLGYSCGSAIQAVRQMKDQLTEDDVVVVLFHDHGSRYVGKVFNDEWMRERGFLNEEKQLAKDLFADHKELPLLSVSANEPVHNAVALMRKFGVSQLPVTEQGKFVGSIDDAHLIPALTADASAKDKEVKHFMGPAFPIVQATDPISAVSKHFNAQNGAALVELGQGRYQIITRHDLVAAMS
ncbi:MAG: pyridoxal-phosphate dependent enzyme [Flavobacteriales bacterium]|nr:pyridoxal-phosphate dependent enzyme [Flavobacteriales bacterium]